MVGSKKSQNFPENIFWHGLIVMRRGWGLENLFQSVILNTPSLKLTFVAFYTNYSRRTQL